MDASFASLSGILAVIVFTGSMIHVMVTDLTQMKIRNSVLVLLITAYPFLAITTEMPPGHIATSVIAGSAVFLGGVGAFAAGLIGGGDAKLAAVSTLWLGADLIASYLLLTAVLGAVICLATLAWRSMQAWHSRDGSPRRFKYLPYGPGMALAALILFEQTLWIRAI